MPGTVHLVGGPGDGRELRVQRAPVMLRFVCDINGKWDVLDLPNDEPTREEEIHVYRQDSWMHVRGQRREDSGTHYQYVHVRIEDYQKSTLRHTRRWRDWARLQVVEAA
jgi:hypothetical protein